MENITADTKNSEIIVNHAAFGLTKDEALAVVMARMAEYTRNNSGLAFGKAPKGGWTDADRIK
jgi:hypothetical protein